MPLATLTTIPWLESDIYPGASVAVMCRQCCSLSGMVRTVMCPASPVTRNAFSALGALQMFKLALQMHVVHFRQYRAKRDHFLAAFRRAAFRHPCGLPQSSVRRPLLLRRFIYHFLCGRRCEISVTFFSGIGFRVEGFSFSSPASGTRL